MFSLKSFRKHASGVISFSGFINSSSSFNLVRGLSGATLLTLQAVKLSLVSIVIYWRGEISMFLLQPEFCSLSHENERIVLTRTIFYYRTNKEALADLLYRDLFTFLTFGRQDALMCKKVNRIRTQHGIRTFAKWKYIKIVKNQIKQKTLQSKQKIINQTSK
ncbi:Hypothetical_protein [Hexamita inflata]|uniref:Hypothetical_protein n=1 Tax=Hexamita inflata TaxID=28002 RepID=A0AA86VRH7_9EUKA|nr:Hypothetical protein HINF_LOCUS62163 [Hexamita inflata]